MYALDSNAARAGDVVGAFISETGKYVGKFTRAEKLVSRQGTHGIGFTFKANDGREARFDVWTVKADGVTGLNGLNTINAIMTCLKLRELKDSPQRVKKYDYDLQKDIEQTVPCFASLMNVDIGLLLRAEEYEKLEDGRGTGKTGWRMAPFAVFQAHTELMATEILDRKTAPEMLALLAAVLKDKPLRKKAAATNGNAQPSALAAAGFPDDDVPF